MSNHQASTQVVKNLCKSVIDLFETERKWCKGAVAKDSSGRRCAASDSNVSSCCLIGGIQTVLARKHISFDKKCCIRTTFISKFVTFTDEFPAHWNDSICKSKGQLIRMLKSLMNSMND